MKITLRDQVKEYLQQQMLDGQISFGERISLPTVANELKVSVTPIREALTQLQQANIVEAIPNRGFFLPKLNKKESSEIYPIIAYLEHLAICQSKYSDKDIEALEKIQLKIGNSKSPMETVTLDLQFHDTLIQNFDNRILKNILADLKIRVFLYEFHYMQNQELSKLSSKYHRNIIQEIKNGNVLKAADLIKESWLTSIKFIKVQFNTKQNDNQLTKHKEFAP